MFCGTETCIEQLLKKAKSDVTRNSKARCYHLHRAKDSSYFEGGVLPLLEKDGGGDSLCPINGKLKGVYFMANNRRSALSVPDASPFGNTQILIPPAYFFKQPCNLYFADYFCTCGDPHYVTLVMTLAGTTADDFCQSNTLQLDVTDNPFLWFDKESERIMTRVDVWIEVFFTEEINIEDALKSGGQKRAISTFGPGRSTVGGIAKSFLCSTCDASGDHNDASRILRLNRKHTFRLTNEYVKSD